MAAIMISVAGINCETYLAINEESIYGERRIKSTGYIPLIPAFSLKGEGVPICVDTHA
jgi:hypothetical protein